MGEVFLSAETIDTVSVQGIVVALIAPAHLSMTEV